MATNRERECAKEPLTEKTDEREKRTGQPGKKNYSQALVNLTIIPRGRVGYEMIDSQRGA